MKNINEEILVLDYLGKSMMNRPIFEINNSGRYITDISDVHFLSDLYHLSPSNDMDGEPDSPFGFDNIKKIVLISKQGLDLPENIQRFVFEFNGDKEGLLSFEKELEQKVNDVIISKKESFKKYSEKFSDIDTLKDIIFNDSSFRYRLLSRLKMDCDFYLGNGNRYSGHLWGKTEEEHVIYMKALWESFPESQKPTWLPWDKILNYENEMVQEKSILDNQIQSAMEEISLKNSSSEKIFNRESEKEL